MKRVLFIGLIMSAVVSQAQVRKYFSMPANADYVRGRVLVKVKDEYKAQLQSANPSIKNVNVRMVSSLARPEAATTAPTRQNTRQLAASIDISKYFCVAFDPSQNVEDYINQLYATGMFEVVEPEYRLQSTFTPNDKSLASQYYLGTINAFKAWDITQGDTTVVIAIIDSGGNLTHTDLAANLFRNWSEYPPNGKDDDGNGFIDDYQGWDFVGNDTLNLASSTFIGDNDPAIKPIPSKTNVGDLSHGTWVAGCASAATNNNNGIAGVGYKTRLMFTKHSADNQKITDPSVFSAYSGIIYAADLFYRHNIRGIINCSFSGTGRSQIIQDIVNFVVLQENCLIVAAAGNSGNNTLNYPASYEHVISVAATDQLDAAASFTNFGTQVDLSAPGVAIYSTQYNNTYGSVSGTSFSSPITSGAAALVWAQNPSFTAVQVGEQLRVTADPSFYSKNTTYANQLGHGRLDVYRALTMSLPSVRATNPKLVNAKGLAAVPGDKAYLSFDFVNSLKATTAGIQITISTTSSAVTISKPTIGPGVIGEGATYTNSLIPFELTISNSAPQDSQVDVLITYSDGAYSDYQYVSFYVNPSFIDINTNKISSTITSIGRTGYEDTQNQAKGSGFVYNQNSLLYEMGLIMGTSSTNLLNNVRGINSGFDQDFASTIQIKQIQPGVRSTSEIYGQFSNSTIASAQKLKLDYRSLVWKDSPYDKFFILEYKLTNPTATDISQYYFGIFADWDVTNSGANDAANWDNSNKLGYVFPAQTSTKPYVGIQLLTANTPNYYAIDNDQTIAGSSSFGLYDGFTDTEKFTTISATIGSGRERLQAGNGSGTGNDVSHVVSAGPLSIPAGQTITVAFAVHAAPDFSSLQTSARYADSVYNYTLAATIPAKDSVAVCYNSKATLNTSGATKVNWYKTFTGGSPFFTGTQYTSKPMTADTTYYVANADHTYESVRAPMKVSVKGNATILASGATIICQGDSVILSVAKDDSTIWNNGKKTAAITVKTAGSYSVKVKNNALGCLTQSVSVPVTVNPKPTAAFTTSGDLKVYTDISFQDQSTSAVSWYWDFGDNQGSSLQNPTHQYTTIKNYTVSLTVNASNGCADKKSSSISVITAIEQPDENKLTVYPNPVQTSQVHVVVEGANLTDGTVSFVNAMGQTVFQNDFSALAGRAEMTIPAANFVAGLYFVRVNVSGKVITEKVIKLQ